MKFQVSSEQQQKSCCFCVPHFISLFEERSKENFSFSESSIVIFLFFFNMHVFISEEVINEK